MNEAMTDVPAGRHALREAWDDMLASLGRARDAIDDPTLFPPPPTDRILAEGYRYLMGFLFGALERTFLGDPAFPYFRRAIQPMDKATIDNADALYLVAEIDGAATYRLSGRVGDHRHWRGEPAAPGGPKAPQYVIFEATTAYAGDTGQISELAPGGRANTGKLDSGEILVAPDGTFEVLLAPEKPHGYEGNFIRTRERRAQADGSEAVLTARYLVLRELFHDWAREEAMVIAIARVGSEGAHPAALDVAGAAERMRRAGEIVRNQMAFWNEFYTVVLETHADMNGDGKRFMPRNDFNEPMGATLATGGGQSTNVYAGGVYELGPGEALIIETRTPFPAAYQGLHLSNLWGESLDFANRQSSLNVFQSEADDDGAIRYVVAHRDPSVPNWLDTTEDPAGFMAARWTYSVAPETLPTISAKVIPFEDVRGHVPAGTRTVSPEERREIIRVRQEHVQRRFRQY